MKIRFRLGWASEKVRARDFKSSATFDLFQDYLGRIGHFTDCVASGLPRQFAKDASAHLWMCDTSPKAKPLSSEQLAKALEKLQLTGIKEVIILIGGPDGFTDEQRQSFKPELLWSFGPMTLPHELAAIVASEQVYRAFTILKGLPYHQGH